MRATAILAAAAILAGCSGQRLQPARLPPPAPIGEPSVEDVETVVFLVGDAGDVVLSNSPVLLRLREEVEDWSARLGRDSAVAVLFLGDIIYPVGLHPPGHPDRPWELEVLRSQVEVVAGPFARQYQSLGIFLAGNHDWGKEPAPEGLIRLRNLEVALQEWHEEGLAVELLPPAGEGGPAVLDLGEHLRLMLLDTAWWLFTEDEPAKSLVIESVAQALAAGGERAVLMAAHHPWESGGAHGGLVKFWETIGVEFLLARSGTLLQDINSVPYRDLRRRLRDVFASVVPPLIFAAGHDHSMQVLYRADPADPRHILVSGSGSKLTDVGAAPRIRFRRDEPGFMRVIVHKDGDVDLFVATAPDEYLKCEGDEIEAALCQREGAEAFRTVFSTRLR